MNVFAVISAVLLAIIIFWAAYHACILFAGMRRRRDLERNIILAKTSELPKFSLIVPAKDDETIVGRCLDALLNFDYPREKLEIVVVVGDSKDSTQQICMAYSEKNKDVVKVVCERKSKGKPAALNLAFAHSTGNIVGVFDADSVPNKDTLQKIASYFLDSSVAALQGSSISLNESQNMLTHVAAAEDKAWFQGLLHGRERLSLFVAFTGSCHFIRSSVLKEMGGWSESSLAEDVELSLKLVKNGRSVKFAPDIYCGQETPFNLQGLITQRTRWYRGYMEASLKYGNLLGAINRRVIDAELSLIGPFVMVVCLISYINWGLSLIFSPTASGSLPFSAAFIVLLNSLTLIALGVSMAVFTKPTRLRNILWVPFISVYWFFLMFIAFWAFLKFSLRRPKVWAKTIKSGFVKTSFVR
jgi:cellulose synthase/poly-beta-1,6-N-acetylglucosamine synthase-like glycosyltransferase